MESSPTPTGPDVERLKIPEELLQQLQSAQERFHASKQALEKSMADADYDHGQHVTDRMEGVRKIEQEMEDLTEKIQEILRRKV